MNEDLSMLLKNWLPIHSFEENGMELCKWMYLGNKKFTDPFFEETIIKCRSLPYNSTLFRSVSSMEILPEWSDNIESLSPTAFIFHVSRCGSTLISQLLGLQPSNIVLSEVPFIDEILRNGFREKVSASSQVKAAIHFYGAKRDERNRHLFIKLDSWHVHFYRQLRKIYPQVPFIMLFRKPDEVIRSHQKRRGLQAVPGLLEPEIFHLERKEIAEMGQDEYTAKVLESYFSAYLEILKTDRQAIPINYNEGALAIVQKIGSLTGLSFSQEEMELMRLRSGFHGKYPEEVFKEPVIESPVPSYMEKAVALYKAVENMRNATSKN